MENRAKTRLTAVGLCWAAIAFLLAAPASAKDGSQWCSRYGPEQLSIDGESIRWRDNYLFCRSETPIRLTAEYDRSWSGIVRCEEITGQGIMPDGTSRLQLETIEIWLNLHRVAAGTLFLREGQVGRELALLPC